MLDILNVIARLSCIVRLTGDVDLQCDLCIGQIVISTNNHGHTGLLVIGNVLHTQC